MFHIQQYYYLYKLECECVEWSVECVCECEPLTLRSNLLNSMFNVTSFIPMNEHWIWKIVIVVGCVSLRDFNGRRWQCYYFTASSNSIPKNPFSLSLSISLCLCFHSIEIVSISLSILRFRSNRRKSLFNQMTITVIIAWFNVHKLSLTSLYTTQNTISIRLLRITFY